MSEVKTFTKEISFIDPAFFDKDIKPAGAHVEKEVTKTATFKEFSRTDKEQRKLQSLLMSVFKSKGEGELQLDHEALVDITERAIEVLLVIDTNFTAVDKTNFLNDNGTVILFGMWLMNEKISPFFLVLIPKSQPTTKTT